MNSNNILWLGEPACHNPALVGGKAAALSRLAADQRIPPGFCVTTTAYANARGSSAAHAADEGPLGELPLAPRCSSPPTRSPAVVTRS